MDADVVADFITVLVIGGLLGAVVAASFESTRIQLAEAAPVLAALVAVGATAGSLYFSEVADFVPCELCWFQRIAMYPLAVILPMAAVRRDTDVLRYVLVLAGLGLAVSAYHIQLQAFPEQSSFCEVANPCSASWVEGLGFATIPMLAAMSFVLIIGLAALVLIRTPETETP